MQKNFLQDMIRIKRASKPEPDRALDSDAESKALSGSSFQRDETETPKQPRRYKLWLVAVISLVFFIFALSYMFLKVTVTVNPKVRNMALHENLSASKDASSDTLPFELIIISGEESKVVQDTKTKDVIEKAKGTVLIYNNFSSVPQRLDIDTRLEGSNGKIYKTVKQIVVPGMRSSAPGSVEVGIYAAAGGEEYNSGPLDFTIFGFKGTPKYSKFYARSKGSIAGGFIGQVPVITDIDKLAGMNDLKIALQAKLLKKATDQIPSGFVLFRDAVFLDTEDGAATSEGNKSSLNLKGTLYGFLFDVKKLTKKIAEDNLEDYDDTAIDIPNIRDLTFTMDNKDNLFFADNPADVKNINFNLSGTAKIIYPVDENNLKADLLGKRKKDFKQILAQYPNIDSADVVISPFWKMSFPDKIKDIKVVVNYP